MASEQNGTETAKPLFYAYSRRSDHENFSRYILVFKDANVCNRWWELVQAQFPEDAVRPAPQLFSFKGDDFPGKAAKNKAFEELKNKWFYTQLGDSTGTGGRSLSLLPAQGYDGTIIARSSGPPDSAAAEGESAGAGGFQEAGEMLKALQSLQGTVEEMAKDVHKVTEAQGKGQEQVGGIVQLLDLQATNQERMRQSLDNQAETQERIRELWDKQAETQERIGQSSDRQTETQERIRESLDRQAETQEKILKTLEKNNSDVRILGRKLASKHAPASTPAPAPAPASAPLQESKDESAGNKALQSAIEQNTNAINSLIAEMRNERKERRALESTSTVDRMESAINALIADMRHERKERRALENSSSVDKTESAINALIAEIRDERRDRQAVDNSASTDKLDQVDQPENVGKTEKPDKDMPLSPAGLVIYPPPRKIRLKKVGFAYEELPKGHASESAQKSQSVPARTKPPKLSRGTSTTNQY
ncbi:hypothetical protein LTS18_007688 [Coniosporium uncinatum]|uniref:Uncharacterized protein n=1 Tax=Coniosporium uncinatum TaxID=93489 RepID=A0ACC3DAK1_9PEZI|nr:hypothetical protein LTS18_007688 [Coniosporium uncinatum]